MYGFWVWSSCVYTPQYLGMVKYGIVLVSKECQLCLGLRGSVQSDDGSV